MSIVKREPLMLPAPVETIEIPGMNRIGVIYSFALATREQAMVAPAVAKTLAA